MNGALLYLLTRSYIGGIRHKLSRLKQPKYLVPAILGVAYFLIVLGPAIFRDGELPVHKIHRMVHVFEQFSIIGFMLVAAYVWLFDPQEGGLLLKESEAETLLAAPLSRRQLLNYSLLRVQLPAFFSSVMIGAIFTVSLPVCSWVNLVGTMFLLIGLYRFGSLAVTVLWAQLRGSWMLWPLRIVPAFMLVTGAVLNLPMIKYASRIYQPWVWGSVEIPPDVPYLISLPIRMLAQSAFAPTVLGAFPGWLTSLCLIILCYMFVLAFQPAYAEETLAAARKRREQIEKRISSSTISRPTRARTTAWPRLASSGPPWRALLWKNAVWLMRSSTFKSIVIILAIVLGCWTYAMVAKAEVILFFSVTFLGPISVFVPFVIPPMLRTDFRGELAQLEILKPLPIDPRVMFFVLVGLTCGVTVLLHYAAALPSLMSLARLERLPLDLDVAMVTVILLIPSYVLAVVVLDNLLVLWLPAWFTFKPMQGSERNGIEYMGKGMLSIFVRVVLMGVLLLVPGSVGIPIWLLGDSFFGSWALPCGAGVVSVLLAIEVILLGGNGAVLFNKLDPSSTDFDE